MDAQVNAWLDRNAAELVPGPRPRRRAEAAAAQPALHATLDRYTVQLGSFLYEASAHRLADDVRGEERHRHHLARQRP